MSGDVGSDERFNRTVTYSLGITAILLLILPMFFVIGKGTAYSAYEDVGLGQVSDMRLSLIHI